MTVAMTSIFIPGEGTYVVVAGGVDCEELEEWIDTETGGNLQTAISVEAYSFESKAWIQLPCFPDSCEQWSYPIANSLGDRYIAFAGTGCPIESRIFIALDWKTKDWLELPSLPKAFEFYFDRSKICPDPINKFTIGYDTTAILDIAPGNGWAQEKLLLLYFLGKAQRKPALTEEDKKPCLLEDLNSVPGVFANILIYLFTPVPNEVECPGSIFNLSEESPRNQRTQEDPEQITMEKKKKKSRTS